MLISATTVLGFRLVVAGQDCGRVKDIYFDASSWQVCHFVVAVGVQRSLQDQKLVPADLQPELSRAERTLRLAGPLSIIEKLPTAAGIRPVCRQYATAGYASPNRAVPSANPHLRSWLGTRPLAVEHDGAGAGSLVDFLADETTWSIRYLKLAQVVAEKQLQFHILPQCVGNISHAAARITLHSLQPVCLNDPAAPRLGGSFPEPMAIHAA